MASEPITAEEIRAELERDVELTPDQPNRVPDTPFPDGISRDLRNRIRSGVEAMIELWHQTWPSIRSEIETINRRRQRLNALDAADATFDDEMDRIVEILQQFREKGRERVRAEAAPNAVQQVFERIRKFVRQKGRREFEVAGLTPLQANDELDRAVRARVTQTVGLIESLPDEFHGNVQRTILDGVNEGRATSDIATDLEDETRVSRQRATRIARDQTGSALGEMQRAQQQRNGLRRAEWRSMFDRRVRGNPGGMYPRATPSHWNRHGQEFDLEQGLGGEFPGMPILCRCMSRPIQRDLEDLAAGDTPGGAGDPQ